MSGQRLGTSQTTGSGRPAGPRPEQTTQRQHYDILEVDYMLNTTNAELRSEPVETRANYQVLTGQTWNALCETMEVLRMICVHLEGDASTPVNESEFKCFRDVLEANKNKAYEILNVVNQIAQVIGCS